MSENFDSIFSQLDEVAEKAGLAMTESDNLKISGDIDFEMNLDAQGNGSYTISKNGWGATIKATATILAPPNALFDVSVRSSKGGGGDWSGIPSGGSVSCSLQTYFGKNTTISVHVHSTVPNARFRARLHYST